MVQRLPWLAHDGRLALVHGVGPRKAGIIRASLTQRLSRSAWHRSRRLLQRQDGYAEPPVHLLLEADVDYRHRVRNGLLPRIAPRRHNPGHVAWLLVMHVERSGFDLTLMWSNSARAHRLDKTHDWVVALWEADGHQSQVTIVTEFRGPLMGKRVVRGREGDTPSRYFLA